MGPKRTFGALLGLALVGALLLGAAALRFLRAGIPLDRTARSATWHGVLIPGAGDLFIHLVSYLLLVLILGGALRALWLAALRLCRTRRFIARCPIVPGGRSRPLARAGRRAGLDGRIDLIADARPLAFCYGLRHTRVALTTGMLTILDEGELEAVLRHEAYHAANRDPLRLVAADALAAAFFFLPLLATLRDHYAVAAELAADRYAVRGMGAHRRLAGALCKLLLQPGWPIPPTAVGAMSALTLRVDALLGEETPWRPRLGLGALCWTSAATAGLAVLLIVPLSFFANDGLALHQSLATLVC